MTGVALHVGIDFSGKATIVTPVGVLSVSTAPQLRDALLKCVADQPSAVIVDLAWLHVQNTLSLSIFGVVARRSSDWSGVPLILVSGDPAQGRLNLRNLALARFVLIAPTLQVALASIDRPPMRRVTTYTVQPGPGAVGSARRLLMEACDRWGCAELADDAAAVADELVSNAIRCAGTDLTLRLELRRGLLTVAVTDDAPQSSLDDPRSDGFGLAIVAGLAKGWGSSPTTSGGKTVWAVLSTDNLPAQAGPTSRRPPAASTRARTGYLSGQLTGGANERLGRGRFGRWVDRQNGIDDIS
jgi:anti-anti-sigma regulatory factor